MQASLQNCTENLSNLSALGVLSLLVPNDDSTLWKERSPAWFVFYYLLIVIYCIIFLALSLICALLLSKKHLAQRFRVRTFIAIDLALMILGLSRTLFLLLDPWGQSRYCTHFACTVISGLLGSLAFPSLTASYTLVFMTLWISARIVLGRSWLQNLKILIPLCCIHYVVALIIEIIILLPLKNTLVVLSLLVGCEILFSFWGFLVCFMFVIAGIRLLRTVEKSMKSSSVICKDSPNMKREDLIEKSMLKNRANLRKRSLTNLRLKNLLRTKQKRAERKITAITYVTVVLGMAYSILNIVNLIIMLLSVFDGCPGKLQGRNSNPDAWLAIRYMYFTLEICLAVFLTYAINDYTPLINGVATFIRACFETTLQLSPDVQDNNTISKENFEMSVTKSSSEGTFTVVSSNGLSPSHQLSALKNDESKSLSPSPLSVSFLEERKS